MMRMRTLEIGLAVAVLCASPVAAQQIGDRDGGQTHARNHCAQCHGIEPADERSPVAQAPTFRAVAGTPGMTRTALAVWFRTPHPSMPNLIIAPSDQDDLITYILSLKDPG